MRNACQENSAGGINLGMRVHAPVEHGGISLEVLDPNTDVNDSLLSDCQSTGHSCPSAAGLRSFLVVSCTLSQR